MKNLISQSILTLLFTFVTFYTAGQDDWCGVSSDLSNHLATAAHQPSIEKLGVW